MKLAPEFSLKDQHGNEVNSSDYYGKQPIVIYFYPHDNTPVCTKETCEFRDKYEDFQEAGAEVIGISVDDVESHSGFAVKHRVPFKLLSDPDKSVHHSFGVKPSLMFFSGRETFVIDKNREILLRFNSMLDYKKHVSEALQVLKKSNTV